MKTPQKKINELISTVIIISSLALAGCSKEAETISESEQQTTQTVVTTTESTTEATTTTTIEATTTTTMEATTETTARDTYFHNDYYDVVDEGFYTKGLDQYIIHKVYGRIDGKIEASAIAYDADGNVIGKATNDLLIMDDNYNFIEYKFDDTDLTNANISYSATYKELYISTATRVADISISQSLSGSYVKLNSWNTKKDKTLYLSLELNGSELSYLDKFKVLYYKEGKIVGSGSFYFSSKAKGLTHSGATDVAELSIPSSAKGFDDLVFIFEPSEY